MDNVDIAQQQQEIMLAQQLAKVQVPMEQTNNRTTDGKYECIDCGDLVEPQRVKLGLTLRCIACQKQHEQKENQCRIS